MLGWRCREGSFESIFPFEQVCFNLSQYEASTSSNEDPQGIVLRTLPNYGTCIELQNRSSRMSHPISQQQIKSLPKRYYID